MAIPALDPSTLPKECQILEVNIQSHRHLWKVIQSTPQPECRSADLWLLVENNRAFQTHRSYTFLSIPFKAFETLLDNAFNRQQTLRKFQSSALTQETMKDLFADLYHVPSDSRAVYDLELPLRLAALTPFLEIPLIQWMRVDESLFDMYKRFRDSLKSNKYLLMLAYDAPQNMYEPRVVQMAVAPVAKPLERPRSFLAEFQHLGDISSGKYGSVTHVLYQGKEYALKKMFRKSNVKECRINQELLKTGVQSSCFVLAEDIFVVDKLCYLLLPYLKDYKPLRDFIINHRLTPTQARTVTRKIIECMENMHSKGWTHNDLHANNVMLREVDLDLKIIDFTLAQPAKPVFVEQDAKSVHLLGYRLGVFEAQPNPFETQTLQELRQILEQQGGPLKRLRV